MPSGNSSGIIAALKVCVSPRDLWRGSQIHLELLHRHGQHSVRMGNTLISMYARCGSLAGARVVFDRLPCHDVVSWTNLILAYAGNAEEALALEIFRSMEARGVEPEARTFVAALAACSGLGEKEEGTLVDGKVVKLASLDRGMALHCGARERGFDGDMFVTNTLIAMYAKCGCLVDASMAFTGMELHTVVSWNALIVGCLDNGKAELALELFQFMNQTPYKCVPAARTFAAVLMACSSLGSKLEDVIRMHSMASSMTGCLDMYVENGLVAAYAKCGSLASSRGIFRRMPCHSVVSWTSMIQAEAEAGNFDAAMETFEAMKTEGCAPNPRTFLALLMACSKLADDDDLAAKAKCLAATKSINFEAMESHCLDIFVANSLIDVYGKCGSMTDAREVFERVPCHGVISWNVLIQGYAETQDCEAEALVLFDRVQRPDSRTFVAALTACAAIAEREMPETEAGARLEALKRGTSIHSQASKIGLDRELHVENSLIDMYSKCGSMTDAGNVFKLMIQRNVTSWTALIQGYVQDGQPRLALELFQKLAMAMAGDIKCQPNSRTFLAALSACGELASLQDTRLIHSEICKRGILDVDAPHFMETSLVDVYGKCGSMVDAELVFDSMQTPTTVSWGALMAGFSRSCDARDKFRVFGLLDRMKREGGEANGVIFLAVLTACNHLGLIDRGRQCFESMIAQHGIQAGSKHYQCIVDMFGRSNLLEEAMELLEQMQVPPDRISRKSMLSAVVNLFD